MLTAIPRGWLSWDFTLQDNEKILAEIRLSSWREKGTLDVAGETFQIYREGLCSGAFVLESRDAVVVRARKPSAWTRRVIIEAGGAQFELKPRSSFTRGFQLLEHGRTVGTLLPASFWNRKMNVDLPEGIPLPKRAFMVWIVVLLLKRDAAAAG